MQIWFHKNFRLHMLIAVYRSMQCHWYVANGSSGHNVL